MEVSTSSNQSLLAYILLSRKFWGASGFALGAGQTYPLIEWVMENNLLLPQNIDMINKIDGIEATAALSAALAMTLAWAKAGQYVMERLHDAFVQSKARPPLAVSPGFIIRSLKQISISIKKLQPATSSRAARKAMRSIDQLISLVGKIPHNHMILTALSSPDIRILTPLELKSIFKSSESLITGKVTAETARGSFDFIFSEVSYGKVQRISRNGALNTDPSVTPEIEADQCTFKP